MKIMNQSTEQRRAAHTWQCARQAKTELDSASDKDQFKDYVNAAKGMPALIMNSGLMQVMAYFHAKKETRYRLLSSHLRAWLHETCQTPEDFRSFMEKLMQAEAQDFRMITMEAFAWLRWMRQMAPAVEQGGS
jgi:CRISPR-associated protein Cmr5